MVYIVEELIKGRDITNQLQDLIQNSFADDLAVLQQKELVDKLFGLLNKAISVISSGSSEYSGEGFQIPVSPVDREPVNSGTICKKRTVKDLQRTSNKIRKSLDPWIKVSSSVVDEYAWRKYGQKGTCDSKFPRCYFRCTHKHEQGCKAIKQVQKIQDEPIKYKTSYFGHHTCSKTLQLNLETHLEESYLINFQSYTPSGIYPSTPCPNSVKEENNEVPSELTSAELPPSDSIAWPDLTSLVMTDTSGEFFGGVYSYASPISYHGMDTEFFSECDGFANYFQSNSEVI